MEPKMILTPVMRFWRLLKPDQKEISTVYFYSFFRGIVNLSLPLGIQAIVNMIQGGVVNNSWILLIVFVVFGIGVHGVLQIFQMRIIENLQQKIFSRAAFDFAYRIPRIKIEALYKHYAPELMNRFFDTIALQKGLSKILIDFSSASLHVIFGLLLLSLYHPFFILYSLILLFLIYLIYRFTARRGLATSLAESKHKYQMAHWLEEVARTSNTFKLAGSSDLVLDRTDMHLGAYLSARESHFKVLVKQYGLNVIFQVLIATGLLAVGGMLVMNQKMNIGQFVAAEIIIISVLASIEKLVLSLEVFYDIFTALEKIGQVTDLELDNESGFDFDSDAGEMGMSVDLKNVSFKYPGRNDLSLHQLDLTIKRRERVVIHGENGAGKSTLLQVLAGIYDLQGGTLSYNGFPKDNLKLSTLRAEIGDCLSQEQLFRGTLIENISMGRDDVSKEDVFWAVRSTGLEDFVKSLSEGYQTVIDPQGKRLPRSVIQRIILARSIASRPGLILLEDAFEHLDKRNREKIIDFLTSDDRTWTLVAVSSDPYLMKHCDRILEMKKGRLGN